MANGLLSGTSIVVAGAGLSGLAAALDLEAAGASVVVLEARDRVGGRVHTLRGGFEGRQHAEAGADLIEGEQKLVLDRARALGLETVRILRAGFGYYGADRRGRHRVQHGPRAFAEAARRLQREIDDYRLAGERWDSAVAVELGRWSVAQWLARTKADRSLASGVRGLRGFFLADPEELSLLPLVDQFASGGAPGGSQFFRIRGGNDRLPRAMAGRLRGTITCDAVIRRVRQATGGVRVGIDVRGRLAELRADFLVVALPASTLQDVSFSPGLPPEQQRAIRALRYGQATRVVLQFERPFWRKARRPRAFGTDLPLGAVWDGGEDQRAGPGLLSLLAGGRASREVQQILANDGPSGLLRHLTWLGKPAALLRARAIAWEADEWARGGYAYFDPSFDPRLRQYLARPSGRIVFAGEHTSVKWQGYMNGALESGQRAAAEIRALKRLELPPEPRTP